MILPKSDQSAMVDRNGPTGPSPDQRLVCVGSVGSRSRSLDTLQQDLCVSVEPSQSIRPGRSLDLPIVYRNTVSIVQGRGRTCQG